MTQAQDRRETLARVAVMLGTRKASNALPVTLCTVSDALTLCAVSRSLSRIAERGCNEDRHCRKCDGEGLVRVGNSGAYTCTGCQSCAGTGSMDGKRERRLEAKAQAIAGLYGLRCYFQGDCRGAALYLIDAERWPLASEDDCHYSSRGTAAY